MIPYIIHVGVIIAGCLLFYKIFLQKETFYSANRWVLLVALVISFLLPLVPIPSQWSWRKDLQDRIKPLSVQPLSQESHLAVRSDAVIKPGSTTDDNSGSTQTISWVQWLYYLYIAGVVIFGANLLFQLSTLTYQSYTKPVVRDGRFRIIETTGNTAPCSFGNNIFINPSRYDWDTYNQILLHEKIHGTQRHTLDIVLAELALVFQWFNPFAWLFRKQVENNLEFLTDDSMINKGGIEKSQYQLSLLKVSVPHLPLGITTNYNQSLLKKRIAMMNVKKSSLQTAWKYFFLIPLLTCFVCALNQPVAIAQSGSSKNDNKNKSESAQNKNNDNSIETEGTWFATIKKGKISFEFKSSREDHNGSSSTSFLISEFSTLPRQEKGDFSLTRDAGVILFNGKFDGDIGYGHYSFKADDEYKKFVQQQGINGISKEDMFTFFMVNVTKAYVKMLQVNGYGDISKDHLIAMAALGVDEPYIRFWKQLGYNDVTPDNLISSHALGIDSDYVSDIQKAGYKNLPMDKLTGFKAQGITGEYIQKLQRARTDKGLSAPSADEIMTFKAMAIDPSYVKDLADAGYADIPYEELFSLKSLGVTVEFIRSLEAIGYKNLPVNSLLSLKSLDVTPEFIKGFESVGYKNIPVDHLVSFKSMGIKPEFIRGFKNLGFTNVTLDEITTMKAMDITPAYIASMRKKGFESKDINKYVELKSSFREVQ